ncbi:MAG TPA: phenylalanine--tRNA ligase beta subunit-related protein, partial [Phycisphaerales bacterium]|nr:phenylalanine--tRNA ligase beta subunit-related protein [Phycisphaerales bacterium]
AGGARPVSLAGVMGGALTEVSGSTTDVLLEGATWDPARVRLAARRHGLRTDASHRFERTVDARTVAAATRRAAALVLEVAGGQMHSGELAAGADLSPAPSIRLRLDRADALLGTCVSSSAARRLLGALGVEVAEEGGRVLVCRPPAWRPDLTREVDLIEEIARLHGLDQVPMRERIEVTVVGPQESETAAREAARVLTAQGFFETVTFTFVSRRVAEAWAPPGAGVLQVCDQRRAAEPALRPSLLPGLLACRKRNHDAGARVRGGVRLFEMARVFAERPKEPTERAMLALLADAEAAPGASEAERRQTAVRLVRGALEEVARTLGGPAARLEVAPLQGEEVPGFEAGATGLVRLGGRRIGHLGLVAARAAALYGLDEGPAGAELELGALLELFPPRPSLAPIPEFPAIERDLSLVVDERVRWEELERLVLGTRPEHLEGVEFVGAFRGRQIGAGRKSLTLRVRFRDPARTLRHEEVDPQITLLVERARAELGATLRG